MPALSDLFRYLILGMSLGAVYAVSGVGLVVLYRTTGVLNFSFGAIGAMGAHVSWSLLQTTWCPHWVAYLACLMFTALVSLTYGAVLAPQFSQRDALTKSIGTLGFALVILGVMFVLWRSADARRFALLPHKWKFSIGGSFINATQITAIAFGIVVTVLVAAFLRVTPLGSAMRAIANDREVSSLLGVPVRRIEAVAWLGSGVICGAAGLFLADMIRLDEAVLTFFVIAAFAGPVVGRLRSLPVTFVGGMVVGIVENLLTPFHYKWVNNNRSMAPYIIAFLALLWFGRKRTIMISGRATR